MSDPQHGDATPPHPLLFNTSAATAYLGIPRTRLYELQRSGELPGLTLGGRRYWRRTELDTWVAQLPNV